MNPIRIISKVARALVYGFRPSQLFNRGLYEVSYKLRLQTCRYQPVWLSFYVSSRCNFQCRFCTNHAAGEKGKVEIGLQPPLANMEFELFRETLDRFDRSMVCTFCGVGEPFINRDLFKMIRHAHARKLITEVVTNGSLLNASTIEQILSSGLDRITISLLESDASSHSEMIDVDKPYFEQITESIVQLGKAKEKAGINKPVIKISRVLTQSSLQRAYDFIELGLQLGANEVLLNNLIFAKIRQFEMRECLFDTTDNRDYFHEMSAKYQDCGIKLQLPVLIKEHKQAECDWYWKNMSIDAEGNVTGCGRFITPKPEYGSVSGNNPWNGPHFLNMRERFNTRNLLECCKNCIESSK